MPETEALPSIAFIDGGRSGAGSDDMEKDAVCRRWWQSPPLTQRTAGAHATAWVFSVPWQRTLGRVLINTVASNPFSVLATPRSALVCPVFGDRDRRSETHHGLP